jgi:hypothetical protein
MVLFWVHSRYNNWIVASQTSSTPLSPPALKLFTCFSNLIGPFNVGGSTSVPARRKKPKKKKRIGDGAGVIKNKGGVAKSGDSLVMRCSQTIFRVVSYSSDNSHYISRLHSLRSQWGRHSLQLAARHHLWTNMVRRYYKYYYNN